MKNKKILSIILLTGVIASSSILLSSNNANVDSTNSVNINAKNDITIMAYKPAKQINASGFQIDKFEKVETVAWLNNNEVLTLSNKGDFKNPDSRTPIRYCSIYDLNTKNIKEFKNVDIAEFLGISPDKKYVIYKEPRVIPKVGSEEWKKSIDSGKLFHTEIKLLNLSTGEITKLNTENNNYEAEFIWIDNNKILANYFTHWTIIDMSGKVYEKGDYNVDKYDSVWIAGTDIKNIENNIKGKIYYNYWKNGEVGTTLLSMDIKTKEIKELYHNNNSLHATKQGQTIIIDNHVDNGELSPGVFNRSFGAYILDEKGKVLKDLKFTKPPREFVISPDGSKIAYAEGSSPLDGNAILKVIDVKTGTSKEIMNGLMFSNICWDDDSTSLSFTNGNSALVRRGGNSNEIIDTYIVSLYN